MRIIFSEIPVTKVLMEQSYAPTWLFIVWELHPIHYVERSNENDVSKTAKGARCGAVDAGGAGAVVSCSRKE